MKHFSLRVSSQVFLAIFSLVLFRMQAAYAQTWSSGSATVVCPEQIEEYVLNIPSGWLFDSYSVTGGFKENVPSLSGGIVRFRVRWLNLVYNGELKANLLMPIYKDGKIDSYKPQTSSLSIGIKSLNSWLPGYIDGLTSRLIPWCTDGAIFTFTVPLEYYPGVPNLPITDYIWEVPAGWVVTNAQALGNNRYMTSGRSLSTIPPNGGGNTQLRVQAYSKSCNELPINSSSLYSLVSQWRTLDIVREPTVSMNTAPYTIRCADRSPRTFSIALSQQYGANVTWTLPNGWTFQTGTNTSSPTVSVIPNGSNGGTISAKVTYSCTSPAKVLAPVSVTVDFNQSLAAPSLSTGGNTILCNDQDEVMVTAKGLNAQGYQWYSSDLYLNGRLYNATNPLITSVPNITVRSTSNIAGSRTLNCRTVESTYGCAPSIWQQHKFTVGAPPAAQISGIQSLLTVGQSNYLSVNNFDSNFQYIWSIYPTTGCTMLVSNQGRNVQLLARTPGNYNLELSVANECGEFVTEFPISIVKSMPITSYAVSPNPSANAMRISRSDQAAYTATLYDSHGRLAWQKKQLRGTEQVRTLELPDGLYLLHLRDANGAIEVRRVQIKH